MRVVGDTIASTVTIGTITATVTNTTCINQIDFVGNNASTTDWQTMIEGIQFTKGNINCARTFEFIAVSDIGIRSNIAKVYVI